MWVIIEPHKIKHKAHQGLQEKPSCPLCLNHMEEFMQIDIIGVAIDLGADRRGVDMGPSAIRYAQLHQKLKELGYTIEDKGNIDVPIQ